MRFLAPVLILSFGCEVRRVAVSELAPTLARGARAMESEPDLEVAKSAIPTTLKQTEGLLETAPNDRVLLESAAQGSLEYAFGILLDQLEALPPSAHEERRVLISRATKMYDRALVYSGRSLAQLDKQFPNALGGDLDSLRAASARIDKRGARALLFAGMSIASAADLDRGDFSRLVDLPKAIVLLERAHELDPDDFHAGAAMTLGLVYASPAMAGSRDLSQKYFDEAIRRTGGKFLLIQGLMARTLFVDRGDRQAFRATLQKILDTPENVNPDSRLPNLLARRRAARDLAREHEFFAHHPTRKFPSRAAKR
jgi:tetratricopeptide (TPR) repeat protein